MGASANDLSGPMLPPDLAIFIRATELKLDSLNAVKTFALGWLS